MISNSIAVAGAAGYNSGSGMVFLYETNGVSWAFKDMVIGLGGLGETIDVARDVGWFVTGMPSSTSGVLVCCLTSLAQDLLCWIMYHTHVLM